MSDLAPGDDDVAWPETLCTVAKAIIMLQKEDDDSSSECVTAPSAAEAIEMVRHRLLAGGGDSAVAHVLVSGSLYLVGSVLDAVNWSAAESTTVTCNA